ncbi:meiosis-specific transcription factor ndt80 [Mortierella sp. AD011]|nr:meiosis-specific transcription factor ndt80 [Mortierella sp. AD010]KAF9401045.1 meiosis-specific transcription factor ndt80 [Mortierella sp. AD011]
MGAHSQFAAGYHTYHPSEQGHSMFMRPDQDGIGHRYSLPAFPQGVSANRIDNDGSSMFPPYIPNSDGPIIHHRNSIAGSTLPSTTVRSRRAGSLAMVEDVPFFSNTKQFYNIYNMNQTQSYKLRVMARIDRGFFTANKIWTCYRRNYFQVSTAFNILGFDHTQESEVPCLIELKDPALASGQNDPNSQRDPNAMIGSLDGLKLNDNGDLGSTPSRLAVVTSFSICITSKIASSEKKIDLIQHTPKRDKGPQIVPGLRHIRGGGALTISGTSSTQTVVTFERVQFKTATANNGKRRAAQQFYILMVDLYAHTDDGQVFCVASSQSDSLVVRGRSPGHYIDTPERDLVNAPGSSNERRLSSISQHSAHPYHGHYSGSHGRSHSMSAGTGVSVDVTGLGIGGADGGPYSPMSPGVASEYSPTAGSSHMYYQHPGHQTWTDASSMSSPASTYDGSTFSSPVAGYPSFQPYSGQHSPQEQSHSSYFAQRQPSFGSITPRLMMGATGASPRHFFDSQLEPPMENSYEGEDSQSGYSQSYNSSPSGHPSSTPTHQGIPYHRGSHPLPAGHEVTSGAQPDHPFVKIESQDGYFPYSGSFAHSSGHPLSESAMEPEPTPSPASAPSITSSFGYPVHDLGGMEGRPPTLPENSLYEGPYESNHYKAAAVAHHNLARTS